MEEDIIKEFLEEKNAEKVDLISLLRTFKKEGLENFVVIRVKKLENLLKAHKEDEAVIEEMAEYIGDLDIDEDICKKKIDDCYVDIYDDKACKDCVKEYFRNKVKGEKE